MMLYIRSFVTMAIGVYTSRVLLQNLGVDNFGLYGLVGGVLGIFSSLRGVFASSVQRFMNFEKGKGNEKRVNDIFCISLLIHLALAVLFFIMVGAIGHWLITNKLVIPDGRMNTALFVFYLTIMTSSLSVLTIPYDAAIIANERFSCFAWISMVEALFKLGIIYVLPVFSFDRLSLYAVLMTCCTLMARVASVLYGMQFRECKLRIVWDKCLLKELSTFAGWNFLGNTVYSVTNEGINMILNVFGGVVANAARGLAYQVRIALQTFSMNVVTASQPFIVQQAASEDKAKVFGYANKLSFLYYLIMLITIVPFYIYCEPIIKIWLVTPPKLSLVFIRLSLIYLLIRSFHSQFDILFKAFGKIKIYQIIDFSTLILSVPLSYVLLGKGMPIYVAFVIINVVETFNLCALMVCAKKVLGMSIHSFIIEALFPCLKSSFLLGTIGLLFGLRIIPSTNIEVFASVTLLVIIEFVLAYIILAKSERIYINKLLKKFFKRCSDNIDRGEIIS